eukprot:CAMPEP_0171908704 /NCGR_PEP_ID=MMETSP0993-20121228/8103_1 /TAXON_ID=483369 /ORGANISM="non described non described, Strain CCMP2098" /LENGTH=30 /DNA_ID= /DNA_START= /DNA_END= /DNA_ORIENTATION=
MAAMKIQGGEILQHEGPVSPPPVPVVEPAS